MNTDLSAKQLSELFVIFARAVVFDALRLKPREKQFALLLAVESLGRGQCFGDVGISRPQQGRKQSGLWCRRLSDWRGAEIWTMYEDWRRSGWLTSDVIEGTFRLCPDKLPGWADVMQFTADEGRLPLASDEDIHKLIAKFSQSAAFERNSAKISQPMKPPDFIESNRCSSADVTDVLPEFPRSGITGSSVVRNERFLKTGITDEERYKQIDRQCDENELMRELSRLLDNDPKNPGEIRNHGGHWRVQHVRQHPQLLNRLLIQLQELIDCNWQFSVNRAAWLESAIKAELRRKNLTTDAHR